MSAPSGKSSRNNNGYGAYAYVDLGLRFAIAIALAAGGGYWLDNKIHTSPLFLILGVFIGLASGILTLYRAVYPSDREGKKGE